MTIKKQLLFTIIFSTLIPMVIMPWLGYLYIRNTVKEQLLLQGKRQLEEITRNLEEIMDDVLMVSNVVAADEYISGVIRRKGADIGERKEIIKMLENFNAVYLYRYNAAIVIYDSDGEVYSTLGGMLQQEDKEFRRKWKEDTIENKDYFLWKTFPELSGEDPILGMSRNLYEKNGIWIGVICIEIYQDLYMGKLLYQDNELDHTERYLVNENGEFVLSYSNHEGPLKFTETLYQELSKKPQTVRGSREINIGSERYIFLQDSVEKTGWKMVQVVPYNEIFAKLIYYRNFNFISNLVCLLILILLGTYMVGNVGTSLSRLGEAMGQVRKGHFITLENREKNKEIRQIFDDFNNMSTRLGILFEENRRITREKEKSRLLALQAQIQPHFLLNTLNGIKWLCIIESAPTAQRMIESLGHILGYSLGERKDCITLEEELICLKHYVELQKMRYGNIFDVEYQIQEPLAELEVPVLILQPLVENSIIHGIREKKERGHILISAAMEDGQTILTVEDNGEGMSRERIKEILSPNDTEHSIGVANVKERIGLYYLDSKFEITSQPGRGTRIRMILGIRRE